jgi:5-deoxy-5-amino-3-dehydroquinate synthase
LVYAAELAHELGRIDETRVAEHRRVVSHYDLPMVLPPGVDRDEVIALFGHDKKALTGTTFVLDGADGVEVVTGVPRDAIEAAFDRIGGN